MIFDSKDIGSGIPLNTDICIIGGGPAGIILALELAKASHEVILLESGGYNQEPDIKQLSVGENSGLPYYPVSENRYRALGGTTHLWAGWSRPLDPIDLKRRSWVNDSGWPISYDELYSYYQKAHEYFSLSDFNFEPDYWSEKYRIPAAPFITDPLELRIYQINKEVNFGQNFSKDLSLTENVQVILHATATELLTEKRETNISCVVVLDRSKRKHIVRAKTYILACGGIENARMLLLSGVNRRVGLGNVHDNAGRYFMEHVHFNSGAMCLEKQAGQSDLLFSPLSRPATCRIFLSEKFQHEQTLLNYNMSLEPVYLSQRERDDMLFYRHSIPRPRQNNKWSQDRISEQFKSLIQRLRGRQAGYSMAHTLEQIPNVNSRIYLSTEKDPLGQFKACIHWDLTGQDRACYLRSRKTVIDKLTKAGIGRFIPDSVQDQKWPPDPLQGSRGHHMGTTRMNDDPRKGVVDKHCKVHGIENLFIAGSSVFPTSGSGTPTYTIAALAIRLADHLKSGIRN